jgi:hypothetical protein
MKAAFAEMREKMDELNAQTDKALGKILNKTQKTRLTQIALRRQGLLNAIQKEEVQTKLNMSEDQIGQVTEILDASRKSQGDLFKAQRDIFTAYNRQRDAEKGGNADDGAGAPAGGPNGGGPGGGGRGRRGFDPAAFKAMMDDPDVKEQLDKSQKQQGDLQNQTMLQVGKVLTKRQKATWNAMIGKDFDVDQLNRRPGDPAQAKTKAATKTDASTTTKAATATTPAPTKKKSQRRRLPGDPE